MMHQNDDWSKAVLCASIGKYKCSFHPHCRFAHSMNERDLMRNKLPATVISRVPLHINPDNMYNINRLMIKLNAEIVALNTKNAEVVVLKPIFTKKCEHHPDVKFDV